MLPRRAPPPPPPPPPPGAPPALSPSASSHRWMRRSSATIRWSRATEPASIALRRSAPRCLRKAPSDAATSLNSDTTLRTRSASIGNSAQRPISRLAGHVASMATAAARAACTATAVCAAAARPRRGATSRLDTATPKTCVTWCTHAASMAASIPSPVSVLSSRMWNTSGPLGERPATTPMVHRSRKWLPAGASMEAGSTTTTLPGGRCDPADGADPDPDDDDDDGATHCSVTAGGPRTACSSTAANLFAAPASPRWLLATAALAGTTRGASGGAESVRNNSAKSMSPRLSGPPNKPPSPATGSGTARVGTAPRRFKSPIAAAAPKSTACSTLASRWRVPPNGASS